tara:strand:+ start:83 stop:286 length:204 start_codon:yes stop_codon:yes gene_type:complete
MWSEVLIGSVSVPFLWVGLYQLGRWSSRVRITNNIKEMEKRKEDWDKEILEQKEALKQLDNLLHFSY